jgi:hypothetical protein
LKVKLNFLRTTGETLIQRPVHKLINFGKLLQA